MNLIGNHYGKDKAIKGVRSEEYGKIRYDTKEDARKALSDCIISKHKDNDNRRECSIYMDSDNGWYLTSYPLYKKHRRYKSTYSKKHTNLSSIKRK